MPAELMKAELNTRPVSILIPTYNGLTYTRDCIDSLERTQHTNYTIIVIDNGSNDGTIDYIRSKPRITLIENRENLGFAKAVNAGIKASNRDSDIVILNNDILFTDPLWLSKLQVTAYSHERIGIVGCRLLDKEGCLLHAGTYMPVETYWGQQIGSGEEDINQYNDVRVVEGVVFACVYIKREAIRKIGLLDEDFFAYFDDTDYCLTANKRGFNTVCSGNLTLTHIQNVTTSINRMDFSRIFSQSQQVFKKKWKSFLENRYECRVLWHSIAGFRSGYSVASRALMKALNELNVYVVYKYLYGPGTVFPVSEGVLDDYMLNIFKNRKSDASLPQVLLGQGDVFHRNFGSYMIGFTMLEVDGLPKEWVREANCLDEIWVPSTFNERTFKDSGITKPILVMPLGVDADYFNPRIKSLRFSNRYTFLSLFEWGERKAPEILFRAFTEEFNSGEDVALLCEITNRDADIGIRQEIARMNLRPGSAPVILMLNPQIPRYQMGCVYRSADCFVTPTRGEGFGLPIIEAMACGLPVIATDWSAHVDFFNKDVGYPIKVKDLVPAKGKCPYYEGHKWAEPDIEHLKFLMRYVYENRAEAARIGLRASDHVLSKFNWKESAKRIKERLLTIH
jgi:hypothetical protein